MSAVLESECSQEGPEATPVVVATEPAATALRLIDLPAGACRWPIGEDAEGAHRFCGEPARLGRLYCFEHVRLAYRRDERPQVRKGELR